VDCRRTDRSQPLFSAPAEIPVDDLDGQGPQRHYPVISPSLNDIGAQSPSNEHVDRMAGVLLTYNFYEKELGEWGLCFLCSGFHLRMAGYVQGMSDLCAPIYVVMSGAEEMTFWCFVGVMNRMVGRLLRERCPVADAVTETKLFERSERDEEAVVDFAAID